MLNQTIKFFTSSFRNANEANNKSLFHKNVISYLRLLYDNEIRKNTTKLSTPALSTSSKMTTTTTVPILSSASLLSNECDCAKLKRLNDDYASIWKIGFFTLAFLTTFVALIVIITLIVKIISSKLQSKNKNDMLNYKSARKDSSKTSCASLLDYDTGICTLSSSSNYGLTGYQKEFLNSASSNSLLNKKDTILKSPNAHMNSLPLDNRCFIYGISNKMLIDDLSNFYNLDSNHFNSSFTQINTIPTSFRPSTMLNQHKNEKPIKKKNSQKKTKLNKSCADIIICNEYDAIETPAANASTATVSAATSYSEVSNDSSDSLIKTKPYMLNERTTESDSNFHYLNNNELISSTSILTQELESKLKERRQMIESRSKLFDEDENLNRRQMKCLSMSSLLPEDSFKLEMKSDENLVESTTISFSNTECVCPCHSHSHLNPIPEKKPYRRVSNINNNARMNKNSTIEEEEIKEEEKPHSNNTNNTIKPNKKAKIIIDSSSKLPTKRESIRMLIENKAVSENKQRDLLECHFNHLKQTIQKQMLN